MNRVIPHQVHYCFTFWDKSVELTELSQFDCTIVFVCEARVSNLPSYPSSTALLFLSVRQDGRTSRVVIPVRLHYCFSLWDKCGTSRVIPVRLHCCFCLWGKSVDHGTNRVIPHQLHYCFNLWDKNVEPAELTQFDCTIVLVCETRVSNQPSYPSSTCCSLGNESVAKWHNGAQWLWSMWDAGWWSRTFYM